jgi:hypothetical protein
MSSDLYGPGASEPAAAVAMIDAPVGRKLNNALTMRFLESAEDEPFATALQGGADGAGKKLGILFGFKNGGAGGHEVTYADGAVLTVPTMDEAPTRVARDGTEVAVITRGPTTTAATPDGATILTFLPDPGEAETLSRFRLKIVDAGGVHVGTADVIRPGGGYTGADLVGALDFALNGFRFQSGGSLPLHCLGVRTALYRELTPLERDVLVAASVELGIGVRPYIAEMS